MALFNSTSSTNREVEQGNTFTFTIEPAQLRGKRSVSTSVDGETVTTETSVVITQWRVTVHFAKRYRYVGLAKAASVAIAAKIAECYLIMKPMYALEQYTTTDSTTGAVTSGWKYRAVTGSGAPTCCAAVTPTHADGPAYNIEVDVDATLEAYYDEIPAASMINSLFSSAPSPTTSGAVRDITAFPEGNKTYNPSSGTVTTA